MDFSRLSRGKQEAVAITVMAVPAAVLFVLGKPSAKKLKRYGTNSLVSSALGALGVAATAYALSEGCPAEETIVGAVIGTVAGAGSGLALSLAGDAIKST